MYSREGKGNGGEEVGREDGGDGGGESEPNNENPSSQNRSVLWSISSKDEKRQ